MSEQEKISVYEIVNGLNKSIKTNAELLKLFSSRLDGPEFGVPHYGMKLNSNDGFLSIINNILKDANRDLRIVVEAEEKDIDGIAIGFRFVAMRSSDYAKKQDAKKEATV